MRAQGVGTVGTVTPDSKILSQEEQQDIKSKDGRVNRDSGTPDCHTLGAVSSVSK